MARRAKKTTTRRAAPKRTAAAATTRKTAASKRKPTTAKKAAAKKAAPKKVAESASLPPRPRPGERLHILDVPHDERGIARKAGAQWHAGYGWLISAKTLPPALAPYASRRYSWTRWREHDLAGTYSPLDPAPAPDTTTGALTLRRDQLLGVRDLLTARASRAPEFLDASDVGTGKTLVTIAAVKRMAAVRNVLVICPLSVIPQWRTHLEAMGDGGKRWCLITYESVSKLLIPPASAEAAKRKRTKNRHTAAKGVPRVQWDVVITDESHRLANPDSQQSRIVDRVISGPSGHAAFTIRMSATAGSNPAQLAYLHRGLAFATGRAPAETITLERYAEWCQAHRFTVAPGKYGTGLAWTGSPVELTRLSDLLFKSTPRWAARRRPNWPEQQRFPLPVDLSAEQQAAYMVEWRAFLAATREAQRHDAGTGVGRIADVLLRTGTAPSSSAIGLAAQLRFRQKAGLLRAEGVAWYVADMVEKGRQVAVSVEFLGTGEEIRRQLAGVGVDCAWFTGTNPAERESERLAYQRGQVPVIIFTPAEGFNLHAGDTAAHGNTVPRVTVVAEPRWSPKKALQIEGRSARNGSEAPAYYAYATGTVEERVVDVMITGMRDTALVNGDPATPFTGLAAALGLSSLSLEGVSA